MAIQAALAKVEGVVKGAVQIIARLPTGNGTSRVRAAIPSSVPTVSVRWKYGASGTQPMG